MSDSEERKSNQRKPLSERMERLAACLAAGMKGTEACRECRVSEPTLYEWKKNPAFMERIAELRKELTERGIARLADLMAGKAADTLAKLLDAESDSVKLESVKAVFDLFVNCSNSLDLKARIDAMEAGLRSKQ